MYLKKKCKLVSSKQNVSENEKAMNSFCGPVFLTQTPGPVAGGAWTSNLRLDNDHHRFEQGLAKSRGCLGCHSSLHHVSNRWAKLPKKNPKSAGAKNVHILEPEPDLERAKDGAVERTAGAAMSMSKCGSHGKWFLMANQRPLVGRRSRRLHRYQSLPGGGQPERDRNTLCADISIEGIPWISTSNS